MRSFNLHIPLDSYLIVCAMTCSHSLNTTEKTGSCLLVIADLPVGHVDEESSEIFAFILVPPVNVRLEVGVGTGQLVIEHLHLLAQLFRQISM